MVKACEHGDLRICVARGRSLVVDAKTAADRARGVRMLKTACDAGDADGCGWLRRANKTP